ncbi:MAG: M55 family metallopeptidase [Vulcanimicrobiaceae bacterium]
MRLYISCDMEGTAGICSWMQVDPSDVHEYPLYRRYMTREVRAAIEGARAFAPAEVLVNDSHWDMRNLLWDELPEDVRVISGSLKPHSMMEGANAPFDAAFFTGYHAKIGDVNGALAHTYNNNVLYNVTINGVRCSEAILNAALLGANGIPLVLITGDRTIVEETTAAMPWVTGVIVKDAVGYYSANSMTPTAACDAIRSGAGEAMRRISSARVFTFAAPIELLIETAGVEHADFIELLPAFERIGGRTVRHVAPDYRSAFRAFLVATRLGAAAGATA